MSLSLPFMDKKIIASILVFSALALVIGTLIPGGDARYEQTLPWQIETTTDGATRVFGLVLGKTTVQSAEQLLRSPAKINLFAAPEKPHVVEAYFDHIK